MTNAALAPLRHRILCVEDDARLRRLLVEDLTEAGYDVLAAASAREAAYGFMLHAPALIVCDIRMPGMDGFDFYERLRRLEPGLFGTVFIFLTALADRDNELRGRRLGADDYITKPVDYEILREVIRIRLAGHHPAPPPPPANLDQARALEAWIAGADPVPHADLTSALRDRFAAAGRHHFPSADPELGNTLNALPLGLLILDGTGLVDYANERAATMLGRPRADIRGSRPPPALADFAHAHLRRANRQPALVSASHLTLQANAAPVPAIARLAQSNGGSSRLTVLLPGTPAIPLMFGDMLRGLFGLTAAEGSLATQIGQGAQLADVAAQRGVSQQTVRAQLKSVFGKTGVARQSELVRVLLTLQMAAGLVEP